MENLVTLIDFIRENLHRTNIHIEIDLPQIVVVGEQSSGKSSVLESIVGREFLPKGNGIVTRRPIVLQLINCKKNNGTGTNSTPEFGIFSHIQGKKFENFNDIEAEINNSTNFLLGNTQNISRDPIFLKIFSPRVVNLTLIDLPGLTKIPLIDQPNNISEKLHGIVSEYISNPNSIILAIIPAITDIVNSDALKLIKQFDPTFDRTIGVLTKIDLMDKGTNCLPVLQNKIIHLSLGWVGVINRNHKDLVKRKNLSDCAETERMYFQSHDVYKKISYRCGSMYLQKSITETLKKNIRKCFPILRDGINEQIRECTTNIEKLQKYIGFENDADEANYIIQSAKELNYKIKESLGTSHQSLELEKVSIGVIIQQILNISFIHEYNNIEIYKNTQKDIQIGVENACGVPGFIEIPDVVIRSIVQKNIESMRLCTLKVIKMVQNKLFECIRQSINSDCPYPNLNDCLRLLSLNYIISATANLNNTISFFIDCEKNHINFRHPDFIKPPKLLKKPTPNSCFHEKIEKLWKTNIQIDDKFFKYKSKNILLTLEGTNLTLFSDDLEQELIGVLNVQGCKIKNIESSLSSIAFSIYHNTNKYVLKQMKHLDMKFPNAETMICWKEKLIELIMMGEEKYNFDGSGNDSQLKIEKIKLLIEKYTKIVFKNIHDLLIKFSHHFFINGLENYLQNEITHELFAKFKMSELLFLDEQKRTVLEGYKNKKQILKNFIDNMEYKFDRISHFAR